MKNLFFTMATIALITLSSFTTKSEVNLTNATLDSTVSCKWRTSIVYGGVAYHSEWTYGNCNYTESGRLIPII